MVRLHDGDTALYSAINEQICALSDADIPVEVIPGISAYQAAAAGLASELTLPGVVQTIVLSRAGGRTGRAGTGTAGSAGRPARQPLHLSECTTR